MPTSGYVLLVDDDTDALQLLSVLLERNHYSVLTAESGMEALSLVERHCDEIDVIILDLMMPGDYDGYAVCDWLQNHSVVTREIPVIVLSARSSPQDMARSFASGAFQHITKPYDVHYLLAVVDSMIRMKGIRDSARATAEKFAAIFENAPVGILVVDRSYEIIEMSRILRERYPRAVPGKGLKEYELFYDPPRAEPNPESPLSHALEQGDITTRTLGIGQAGETTWWEMSAAPLFDNHGNITGAVLIVSDVTHQRETDAQLREEMERSKAAEEQARTAVERHKEVLLQQDKVTERLIQAQKQLRQKQTELEEAYLQLQELNTRLEALSITDDLTGIHNRRHFDETFGLEVRRAARYHHSLSVIMLDIDHFKMVNDTYGHPAGDVVLKRLGAMLEQALRETDLVARYGGEEFVMALPETPSETATAIAERLRERVADEVFRAGEAELRITVSMGITTGAGEDMTPKALIGAADAALYEAKNAGRNRVIHGEMSDRVPPT